MELAQPITHRAGHRRATHPGNPVLKSSKRMALWSSGEQTGPQHSQEFEIRSQAGKWSLPR